jgi:hypothetical protein
MSHRKHHPSCTSIPFSDPEGGVSRIERTNKASLLQHLDQC